MSIGEEAYYRLEPGFFRVQKDIEIGGSRYDGVGNVALQQAIEKKE